MEKESHLASGHSPASQSSMPDYSGSPSNPRGSSRMPLIIALVILLAVVMGGGFWVIRSRNQDTEESEPAPSQIIFDDFPSPSPEDEEEIEVEEGIDKTVISINVLNGTGIRREAAYLQGILASLGYEDIEAGNASSDDYEATVVKFGSDVPNSVKKEILAKLEDEYVEVDESTKSPSGGYDIEIITGARPGVTKPTPEPDPTPEPEEEEEEEEPSPTPTESPESTP